MTLQFACRLGDRLQNGGAESGYLGGHLSHNFPKERDNRTHHKAAKASGSGRAVCNHYSYQGRGPDGCGKDSRTQRPYSTRSLGEEKSTATVNSITPAWKEQDGKVFTGELVGVIVVGKQVLAGN